MRQNYLLVLTETRNSLLFPIAQNYDFERSKLNDAQIEISYNLPGGREEGGHYCKDNNVYNSFGYQPPFVEIAY